MQLSITITTHDHTSAASRLSLDNKLHFEARVPQLIPNDAIVISDLRLEMRTRQPEHPKSSHRANRACFEGRWLCWKDRTRSLVSHRGRIAKTQHGHGPIIRLSQMQGLEDCALCDSSSQPRSLVQDGYDPLSYARGRHPLGSASFDISWRAGLELTVMIDLGPRSIICGMVWSLDGWRGKEA